MPKVVPWRSENYRRLVASFACEHCGYAGGQQAAHADFDKGQGTKTDDRTCYSACIERRNTSNTKTLGCHELISRQIPKEHRRPLELRYARQTIARVCRLGLWAQYSVAFPDWYEETIRL